MNDNSARARKIRRRLAVVIVTAVALLTLLVVPLTWQDLVREEAALQQEARHTLDLAREFVTQEFQSIQSDLLFLAREERLQRFLDGDEAQRAELEHEFARFARIKGVYDQVSFIDLSGREVIRIDHDGESAAAVPLAELNARAARYNYKEGLMLDAQEIYVSPLDLNMERGVIEQPIKPVIRFLTPVVDSAGRKRGVLVFSYLGQRLLTRLREGTAGSCGETMLLNHNGDYLLAPDPAREWGWLLRHEHSFMHDQPEAWQEFKGRGRGTFRTSGGLFTIERLSPNELLKSRSSGEDFARQSAMLLVSRFRTDVIHSHSLQLLANLLVMSAAMLVIVLVLALRWVRTSADREEQEQRLAESEARLRTLSSRLLAAREDESCALSRTLHDEIGQMVTATIIDLRAAARKELPDAVAGSLRRAIDQTGQLLDSVHAISSRLRPTVLDDLGLQDAVESHASEFELRTNIRVNLDLRLGHASIPSVVGENAYRIFQEALTNVAAHSRAIAVEVSFVLDGDELQVSITDRGIGFDLEQLRETTRLGVLGMRERAELLGGYFELVTAPGAGAAIRVTIPIPAREFAA